jgi:hypothetical protein
MAGAALSEGDDPADAIVTEDVFAANALFRDPPWIRQTFRLSQGLLYSELRSVRAFG